MQIRCSAMSLELVLNGNHMLLTILRSGQKMCDGFVVNETRINSNQITDMRISLDDRQGPQEHSRA
jgi:hypothetical protein